MRGGYAHDLGCDETSVNAEGEGLGASRALSSLTSIGDTVKLVMS